MKKPSYLMTWAEYQDHFTKLKEKIVRNKIEYLIAVGRGGLVPTTHLSNILDIPMGILFCSSYTDRKHEHFEFGNVALEMKHLSGKCAIIDDMVDSGTTREKVLEKIKSWTHRSFKFYTLVPDNFKEKIDGRWLVFPWEQ